MKVRKSDAAQWEQMKSINAPESSKRRTNEQMKSINASESSKRGRNE
ncbi:hypothetical protein [Paenibacillus sp. FSL H7-0756]